MYGVQGIYFAIQNPGHITVIVFCPLNTFAQTISSIYVYYKGKLFAAKVDRFSQK